MVMFSHYPSQGADQSCRSSIFVHAFGNVLAISSRAVICLGRNVPERVDCNPTIEQCLSYECEGKMPIGGSDNNLNMEETTRPPSVEEYYPMLFENMPSNALSEPSSVGLCECETLVVAQEIDRNSDTAPNDNHLVLNIAKSVQSQPIRPDGSASAPNTDVELAAEQPTPDYMAHDKTPGASFDSTDIIASLPTDIPFMRDGTHSLVQDDVIPTSASDGEKTLPRRKEPQAPKLLNEQADAYPDNGNLPLSPEKSDSLELLQVNTPNKDSLTPGHLEVAADIVSSNDTLLEPRFIGSEMGVQCNAPSPNANRSESDVAVNLPIHANNHDPLPSEALPAGLLYVGANPKKGDPLWGIKVDIIAATESNTSDTEISSSLKSQVSEIPYSSVSSDIFQPPRVPFLAPIQGSPTQGFLADGSLTTKVIPNADPQETTYSSAVLPSPDTPDAVGASPKSESIDAQTRPESDPSNLTFVTPSNKDPFPPDPLNQFSMQTTNTCDLQSDMISNEDPDMFSANFDLPTTPIPNVSKPSKECLSGHSCASEINSGHPIRAQLEETPEDVSKGPETLKQHPSDAIATVKFLVDDPFATDDIPTLEEFIPEKQFPEVLIVHDPDDVTYHHASSPKEYKRMFPEINRCKNASSSGPRIANLYLSKRSQLGVGHHSHVYQSSLRLPPLPGASSPSSCVKVAAKVAIENREARELLRHEAKIYNAFPQHLMEQWCGIDLVPRPGVHFGPVVPKFFGYYVLNLEKPKERFISDPCNPSAASPILLLESCGEPVRPRTFTLDRLRECFSLFLRLHKHDFIQQSAYARNILTQPGPLTVPVDQRSMDTPSFRIIDFGRAIRRQKYLGRKERWETKEKEERLDAMEALNLVITP